MSNGHQEACALFMMKSIDARHLHHPAALRPLHRPITGDGECTYFRTESVAASARLVQALSQLPGVEDHKPDVDLRPDGVTVRLITYTDDYYGMSRRDVEIPRQISAAAGQLGLSPERAALDQRTGGVASPPRFQR